MKHEPAGTHQRPIYIGNSELHRGSRSLSYRPKGGWPPFSGIHKVRSIWTTWRWVKRSKDRRRRRAEKTTPFGEEKSFLTPWKLVGSQLDRCHSKIGRTRLHNVALSTVFSRFGCVQYVFVSNSRKVICWTKSKKVLVGLGGLLWIPPEILFFHRLKKSQNLIDDFTHIKG